jgi:hypothetical protein
MPNARGEARFFEKELLRFFVGSEVRVDDLHRDVALESADARRSPEKYRRHPARTDGQEKLVPSDSFGKRVHGPL